MSWTVIPVNGPAREIPGKATIQDIYREIGTDCLDTVNLHNGKIMMLDDLGYENKKPVNPTATTIFHDVCRPGTTWPICGDVAIVNDEDFA